MTPEERRNDAALAPEPGRNDSVLIGERIGEERNTPSTTSVAEGRDDGGGGLIDLGGLEGQLKSRGVQASLSSLLSKCPADRMRETIAWWDEQETAGPGVLVATIRRGGVAERKRQTVREYADEIAGWLNEHFPHLQQASGNPHPAAVVEVIHLHHELGKGRLLPREYAARIGAAVRRFDEKWGTGSTTGRPNNETGKGKA
jgi:hypothetical protein